MHILDKPALKTQTALQFCNACTAGGWGEKRRALSPIPVAMELTAASRCQQIKSTQRVPPASPSFYLLPLHPSLLFWAGRSGTRCSHIRAARWEPSLHTEWEGSGRKGNHLGIKKLPLECQKLDQHAKNAILPFFPPHTHLPLSPPSTTLSETYCLKMRY